MGQIKIGEGTVINGRYRVIRPLGKGGMGAVYLAEHLRLQTVHALKQVVFPEPDPAKTDEENEEILARSEGEARTLVSLEHPNLPRVTDAFVEDNSFFLVMEFIEGQTLEAKLRQNGGRPLPVRTVLDVGLQISDVLAYLHSLTPPLIFRDLKPANVMVQPDGKVRLIDFGIARRFQPGASRDTALLGSVGYSPPEQFGRAQTDIRSDVYAFGATLHHLLTGRDPITQPFKFPAADSLNLLVPKDLSVLVSECVSMEPDSRPKTMHTVAMRLLQIKDALPPDSLVPIESPTENEGASPLSGGTGKGTGGGSQGYNSAKLPSGTLHSSTSESQITTDNITSEDKRHSSILIAGLSVGGVVALLGLFAFYSNHKPKSKPTSSVTSPLAPTKTAENSDSSTPNEGKTSPTTSPDTTTMPPPKTDTTNPVTSPQFEATFERVTFINVVPNAQGVPYLHFQVSGQVKGKKGGNGVLSLFFFDGTGAPLPAPDSRSANTYRNPDGQLSVAQELPILDDPYHFDVPLYVPADLISVNASQTGVQFRAVLLLDTKKAAESPYINLPLPLPTPQPPTDPNSPSPTSSNPGASDPTKTNVPPTGGGTIK